MAKGTAFSIYDIIEAVDNLLITAGFEEHQKLYYPVEGKNRICSCIWKYTVDDAPVFIQLRADIETHERIFIDCPTTFDELLYCWEQPGSISQWLHVCGIKDFSKNIPTITLAYGELFSYFLLVNNKRLIICCRESIEYETAYIGFIDPLNTARQYAYPVFVGGNSGCTYGLYPHTTGSFLNNLSGNSWLRQPSGEWYNFENMDNEDGKSISLFPYFSTSKGFVSNVRSDYRNQTKFFLSPILVPSGDKSCIAGKLSGVLYIGGARDLSAEDIVRINGNQYIILDNVKERGNNSYFAIKLE